MSRLEAARRALQSHFGYADFRAAQRPVVASVLAGRHSLAVLPTGAGKSVCFQVPAVALGGLTLVVSPLVSLMHDQVQAACQRGIAAVHLAGELAPGAVASALTEARLGRLSLVYVSPERLPSVAVRAAALGVAATRVAVDEAHCISEWGHDFRPAFRGIRSALTTLGSPPVVALTGSATPVVRRDIMASLLGADAPYDLHLASFDRPNLWFGVRPVVREPDRLRILRSLLTQGETAIVYAATRRSTERIARALRSAGHRAEAYHAGLARSRRDACLDRFLTDETQVVVATSAFGMGIDKPGVRTVVHWTMPPTPESYYQEAGRAGRDGAPARCVMLHARSDAGIHRRQLEVTFPSERLLRQLWAKTVEPHRVPSAVRQSAERLRREIGSLDNRAGWQRVEARRRAARARIDAVASYAARHRCRRRALVGYFGERLAGCAGCDICDGTAPGALARCKNWMRERLRPGSA